MSFVGIKVLSGCEKKRSGQMLSGSISFFNQRIELNTIRMEKRSLFVCIILIAPKFRGSLVSLQMVNMQVRNM